MHTNKRNLKRSATCGFAALACFAAVNAYAINVKVTVENLNEDGGLWFTPVFLGFHDDSFDTFNSGQNASSSVETIAEEGNPAPLIADIEATGGKAAVINNPGGPGPGLFAPGASNSLVINLDTMSNQFFSFASMILPSNDAFFGNDDPIKLFDDMGNFIALDHTIFGSNIYDAGTEENDGMGAPFSMIGGMSTDTNPTSSIHAHMGLDSPFVGTLLGNGSELTTAFSQKTKIARVRVQQVPDSVSHIGVMSGIALLGFQFVARRRMGKK